MFNNRNLCKIAVICEKTQTDCFEYKKQTWKPYAPFQRSEILEIIHFLKVYKRTGFGIIPNAESLYFVHKEGVVSGKENCYAQGRLFPIIFKDYTPETDLSVFVSTKELEEQKSFKIVKKFVAKKLYEALFVTHKKDYQINEEEVLDLPENFLPKLCRYQERTVRWLLKHEKCRTTLPKYFIKLNSKDETYVYKNILCGEFQEEMPREMELSPGGILAEEMGLGKTVEMLALILLHKRDKVDIQYPINNSVQENVDEPHPPSPPKKQCRDVNLFCICSKTSKNNIIECNECHIWQHEKCVNSRREQNYICPSCWKSHTDNNLIQSAGTLIITPNTIKKQWVDEIKRHISNPCVRLLVYDGISNGVWTSPSQMASYDIVLTDYNILRREVFYTSKNDTDRSMRHKPRSMRLYTPLLMINWFRVCLDEAQMVESNTSEMAALVRTIPAINRWALTGTPIQRSIDDLYPLIRFIGLEDILNASGWETLVKDFMLHYNEGSIEDRSELLIVKILREFMWRTCKEQLVDELPIPAQTEKVYRVTLTDLERLFYSEQHERCEFTFNEAVNKYKERTDFVMTTSNMLMNIIMKPFLKIRQSCIIPLFISNNRIAGGFLQKQFLQQKELHAHLKQTNEMACKSELRSMASSYNGVAAINFIKGNYREAIKNYESVLKLAQEYIAEKNISVDSLLQIHALYNIFEARNQSPEIALEIPQNKLEEYENQLNDLEWKYLQTYASPLRLMEIAFQNSLGILKENNDMLNENLLDFLSLILEIDDTNFQSQLIAKILDECIRKFGSARLEAASSLRGILFMIVSWHDQLMKTYEKTIESIDELSFYTSNVKPRSQVKVQTWREMSQFINSVYDCHLIDLRNLNDQNDNDDSNDDDDDYEMKTKRSISRKRKRKNQNICKLCKLRDLLNNFECMLFKKSIDVLTNAVEGDENPQLEIEMIKIIFAFLKQKRSEFTPDMEKHYQVLQSMQNFCKKAIKYWIEIEFTVKAYDELEMCKMRIKLAEDDEDASIYTIKSYELDERLAEQEHNLRDAQKSFVQKLARLKYIKHLETSTDGHGPCPICQSEEEARHIVLECGHEFCVPCIKNLCRYNSGNKLTCSICRNVQSSKRVYFVTCLSNKNEEDEPIKVNGNFSSKITYIVKLVLKLLGNTNNQDEYPLKILIFSQWQNVLTALAKAFQKNNISCLLHSNVQTIENFKNPNMGITCLLMQLSKGCKGLNLIEANHVFLIEPILNLSEEQQAIGRVHRFGQTRPTTVHRFIVDDTIEENIHKFVAASKESQGNCELDNLTFENLSELFKLRNNVTANFSDSLNEIVL